MTFPLRHGVRARRAPRRRRELLRVLFMLVVASAAAGVLVAAAVFPVVGAFGLAAKSGADSFFALPAELDEPPLPQASRILARDGSTLAVAYFNENRVLVPLDRVPDHVQQAVLAIEDARFYDHGGVDVRGLARAAVHNSRAGEVQEGASTITQQYVKNVLVTSAESDGQRRAAIEKSLTRKIREARYAIAMERKYTKQQILEKYLNIAYFGNGVYGIGTAAQYYFGKPVEHITPGEGALLAGLVQNPSAYNPVRNPGPARARRDVVLRRMVEEGYLDQGRAQAERRSPVQLRVTAPPRLEDSALAPYFLEHLRTLVLDDPDGTMAPIFGETPGERAQKLFQGGLRIRTTLDPALQAHAQEVLARELPGERDPAGAVVVVQPGTGEILAMAGVNRDARSSKVNLATGGTTGFQPGSTFKPFVLAAAIEKGIPLGLTMQAPNRYTSPVFKNYVDGRIEPYTVGNAGDSAAGVYDLVRASWNSVNTYYVQLEERTGLERPAEIAEAMGLRSFPIARVPSLVLGSNEVSPLDMASAYAAFAAHGRWCRPHAVLEVNDASGSRIGAPPGHCEQAIDRSVADTVTWVLRGVITNGTGRSADIDRPAAGKTGTTNGPSAAWFAGYTPDLAGVTWIGHVREPTKRVLRNVLGYRILYGGTVPARVWRDVMSFAHRDLPGRGFELRDVAPYRVEVVAPPGGFGRDRDDRPDVRRPGPDPRERDDERKPKRCRGNKCDKRPAPPTTEAAPASPDGSGGGEPTPGPTPSGAEPTPSPSP